MEDAGDHLGGAVGFDDVGSAVGFYRDFFFQDQVTVNAADSAAVQGAVENRGGIPIGIAARRDGIADGDGGQRAELFLYGAAAFFGLRWFGNVRNRRQRVRWNVFEIFFIILNITIMKVVNFEYELGHQNKSASVYSDIFCRAFHVASLKKNSRFLSFIYAEICAKYILHHIDRFRKFYHHILMFIFLLL